MISKEPVHMEKNRKESTVVKKEMKTITETIDSLKKNNYVHDFIIINENEAVSKDTNEKFKPEDLVIENSFRFEGESDPDDLSILYALTAKSGTQGILIDAYGIYSTPAVDEFIKKVPKREENELQDREL